MPIQFRRGKESELTPANLLSAEPAFTTDTHKLFIGDGSAAQQMASVTDVTEQVTTHNANTTAHAARFNAKLDKAGGAVSGNLAVNGSLLVGANGGSPVWTAGTLPIETKDWEPEVGLSDGSRITSGHTLSARWGKCTRIGNFVVATYRIRGYFTTPPASGYAAILNLPWRATFPGFGYIYDNYQYTNDNDLLTMMIEANTTWIKLYGGSGSYSVQWAARSGTSNLGDIAGTILYYA